MRAELGRNVRLALVSTTLFVAAGEAALWLAGLPRAGLGVGALGAPLIAEDLGAPLAPYQVEDAELLWRLVPGARWVESHRGNRKGTVWAMTVNARGRRGPDRTVTSGTPVVLCLGDSVTMGYGADEAETYPESLQGILEGTLPGMAVVNAGSNGYSTEQGKHYLAELLPELHPRVVVISFGANDNGPAGFPDALLLSGRTSVRALQALLRRSRIYETLRKEIVHRRLRHATERPGTVPRVPVERYGANLREMVAACRRSGARPILVAPTSKYADFQETAAKSWPAPISVYRRAMAAVAHDLEVPYLDHPLLSGRLAESERYFLDWCHPDARALCVLAHEVAPMVAAAIREEELP